MLDNNDEMKRDEMLRQIGKLRFATLETALYLDTHPNDTQVLERHNYFSMELDKASREYMKKFNDPLTSYDTAECFWTWIERWPFGLECTGGEKR